MNEHGHVRRALVLARELVAAGASVHFFTAAEYASGVIRVGAVFHDLFRNRALHLADAESIPIPSRYVTFAAHYAESLAAELKTLRTDLVIHDSFAVIGIPVSQMLGLPRIAICAGHNMPPAQTISQLECDPRVKISPRCYEAVEILRTEHGMETASPFSYVDSLSPLLNIVSEPEPFLTSLERAQFEPLVFFGSLDRPFFERYRTLEREGSHGKTERKDLRFYASFGTVASRYYSSAIVSLVETIIATASRIESARFIISTGRDTTAALPNPPQNVTIKKFADQVDTLRTSDIYLTHHGLNSTHESIYLMTPMISYPIFHDQPGLARRCQQLGVAVALTPELRGPVSVDLLQETIEKVRSMGQGMRDQLRTLREWEIETVERRPIVIKRILESALR